MDIKKSERFIPVSLIPILLTTDTLSDALDAMKGRNTRLVIVEKGGERWDLWLDEIAAYCDEKGPVTPWMVQLGTVVEDISPTGAVDSGKDSAELELLLEKERAVMMMEGGNLTGIGTADSQALWPPAVSECVQGHLFFPPMPKKCPYDGTIIG